MSKQTKEFATTEVFVHFEYYEGTVILTINHDAPDIESNNNL